MQIGKYSYGLKVLMPDGRSPVVGYQYSLPKDWEPGSWSPIVRTLVPCVSGWHLTYPDTLFYHLQRGYRVFVAQYPDHTVVESGRQFVVTSVRLIGEIKFSHREKSHLLKTNSLWLWMQFRVFRPSDILQIWRDTRSDDDFVYAVFNKVNDIIEKFERDPKNLL